MKCSRAPDKRGPAPEVLRLLSGPRRRPCGLTLIELLVVIGIVGLLASLLLPAVQSAREAARRARCANNQRQLIGACHQFENTNGDFPLAVAYGHTISRVPGPHFEESLLSPQALLLPYLEQGPLFNSINFDEPLLLGGYEGANVQTVVSTRIEVFLCPSDPAARRFKIAPNSYRACVGLGEIPGPPPGRSSDATDGAFAWVNSPQEFRSGPRLARIADGLSNTLAFSEKPISTQDRYHPFRDWSIVPSDGQGVSPDVWVGRCSRIIEVIPRLDAGATWISPGPNYTHFYTSVPPNSRVPDCATGGFMTGGLFAARSYHPGGVNAAMADGSVRWFSSGTAMNVWRSLGTRAGGEAIPGDPGS